MHTLAHTSGFDKQEERKTEELTGNLSGGAGGKEGLGGRGRSSGERGGISLMEKCSVCSKPGALKQEVILTLVPGLLPLPLSLLLHLPRLLLRWLRPTPKPSAPAGTVARPRRRWSRTATCPAAAGVASGAGGWWRGRCLAEHQWSECGRGRRG